jgi:hypothetical protein
MREIFFISVQVEFYCDELNGYVLEEKQLMDEYIMNAIYDNLIVYSGEMHKVINHSFEFRIMHKTFPNLTKNKLIDVNYKDWEWKFSEKAKELLDSEINLRML